MIILPERATPRGKLLMPQRPHEWRAPSQRRTTFGIEDQTRFRLSARLNDGHLVWRGWFDDREDADAFLFALALGTLPRERSLWDLPTPAWRPDLGDHLAYEFATVTFLTSASGSNQTHSVPGDWNNANNTVEGVGGGGGGTTYISTIAGGGGGAGAYAKSVNLTLTPGGSATYFLGAASAHSTAGADCFFNASSFPAAGDAMGAKGGARAIDNAAGAGGASASCYTSGTGAVARNGGNGGNANAGGARGGAGGGGAAGPTGAGAGGATSAVANPGGGAGGGGANNGSTGSANSAGTGGAGGNGGGATGGGTSGGGNGSDGGGGGGGTNGATLKGGNGGSDTAFDVSHGCGGGGGGGASLNGNGGTGGGYGGGGGGGASTSGTGGSGGQGLIVVTYTPIALAFDMNANSIFLLP